MLSAILSFWGLCLLLCVLIGPFLLALGAYQSRRYIKVIEAREAATEQRRMERYRANCRK